MRLTHLLAAAAVSTMCQTVSVQIDPRWSDLRLAGCGAGFPDNVLWNLDRSDSISGALDGEAHVTATGRGAVVYVIDTGIRADHEEFARAGGSNVIAGFEAGGYGAARGCADPVLAPCYENVGPELYERTHGTAVASVIAGTHGIAPDAKLVAIRGGGEREADWIRALELIIAHAHAPGTPPFHTAIINISGAIGSVRTNEVQAPAFDALMRRMIRGVDANGNADPAGRRFLFITVAGNSGPKSPLTGENLGQCSPADEVRLYPGRIGRWVEGLITVGGLTRDNKLWAGSCKGSLVEMLAPAEDVLVASITGRDHYRNAGGSSGTSYSVPYVAGMAARMLELDPSLSPEQLEAQLASSPSRVDGLPVPVWAEVGKRRSVRK